MLIANPIYDTVFNYLMQNLDIAKGVISTIIDEEITSLDFKPQENIKKLKVPGKKDLTSYHLDFIATIRKPGGDYKKVLIELQKTNVPYDIHRFRKYLGDQYGKEDEVLSDNGKSSKQSLPIITIYFLGFYLSRTLPSVIKVNRQYIDVLNGKEIHERSEFIERLTHNSYVIQVPGLKVTLRNRLETILSVFQQENFIDKTHHLKDYKHETSDPLTVKMLKRLETAAADEEIHRELELEEMALHEYESTFSNLEQQLDAHVKKLAENEQQLKEKEMQIDRKDKLIQELLKKLENK